MAKYFLFLNKQIKRATVLIVLLFIAFLINLILITPANAENNLDINSNKKILIVYYSLTGNTDNIAKYIQRQTGADILKVEPVNPYPTQYRAATIQAKKELSDDFFPELKTKISNLAAYNNIILGSPIWWGTVSMPIRTFLKDSDLSGKKITLFITHDGSEFANSLRDIKNFQPNATLLESIAIRGRNSYDSQQEINKWLNQIELNK